MTTVPLFLDWIDKKDSKVKGKHQRTEHRLKELKFLRFIAFKSVENKNPILLRLRTSKSQADRQSNHTLKFP